MKRSDFAYEQLRSEIVDGVLVPPQALYEVELGERLGVSRTPIREALMRLSREGLVESVAGRGWAVAQISVRDIIELYEVREALEALAVRLCAERGDSAVFGELAGRFLHLDPAAADEVNMVVEDLDEALVSECKNARLEASLRELIGHRLRLRRMSTRDVDRIQDANLEHAAICRAIAARDAAGAVGLSTQHIRLSREVVLASLVSGVAQAYSPSL